MKRRKMHSPNKREESEKGKCIEGSTSKSNDIKLLCGQPNSSEQIGFEGVPVVSDEQLYPLDSSFHSKHQKHSIVIHTYYDLTLEEWLERNTNNWCPIYRKWNVYRPTEEAMKLIQCILQAVYDLHSRGIAHGFLHHPENFLIKYDREKIKLVYLALKKKEPKTSAYTKVHQNDIVAISGMIFDQILGGRFGKEYPKDLEDLDRWLSPYMRFRDWTIIVDHPSLWHWKMRFKYIELVWMEYRRADRILKEQMDYCLRGIPSHGWINKIPPNTPLEKMFKNNYFRPMPHELFRYIRIVRFHYMDNGTDPQTEADYLKAQFIEHKTTQVCELLLVHLHRMVCNLGIEV